MLFKNLSKLNIYKRKTQNLKALFGIISLLVVAAGIFGTFFFASGINDKHRQEVNSNLQQKSLSLQSYISVKNQNYRQLLLSASSLFSIKGYNNVSEQDWQTFYNDSKIQQNYPGVVGFGYAENVSKDNIDNFIQSMKDNGKSDYAIRPSTNTDNFSLIKFIQPNNSNSQSALGFNMLSDITRSNAINQARDTGTISISDSVVLRQDENSSTNPKPRSILIYYPIYKNGDTPKTLTQKQSDVAGYIYMAIRIQDVMISKLNELNNEKLGYKLTDISDKNQSTLFTYQTIDPNKKGNISYMSSFNFGDRNWQSELVMPNKDTTFTPLVIFILGLISSMMLGLISFWILTKRLKSITAEHAEEIQKTKDELLALASHQLRTPATGVRQYIGMLKAGYFGELNKEQTEIINKADKANNRQLEIIDQLLYVAKADAGQLSIIRKKYNLASAVRSTIDTMSSQANKKKITIKASVPNKLVIDADRRYIDMIIENLISNSIKYSYPDSKIEIKLKKLDKKINFTIKDCGVGIDDSQVQNLFQKFTRLDNPLSTVEGGTGLGLFLAQKLAIAHGGKITVKSNNGPGVTFLLKLPINTRAYKNVIELTE